MRLYSGCAIGAQPRLQLHDVDDVYRFIWRIAGRVEGVDHDDREELAQYLAVECWRLAERYDGRSVSFSTWAGTILRLRVHDWRRQREGPTVWKFHDRTYTRPPRDVVSLDTLVGGGGLVDAIAGRPGDGPEDRAAAFAGLLDEGDCDLDWDLALIRAAAARRSSR